jgi:hypothetical protein
MGEALGLLGLDGPELQQQTHNNSERVPLRSLCFCQLLAARLLIHVTAFPFCLFVVLCVVLCLRLFFSVLLDCVGVK